jgi:hypothetical protein
MEFPKREDIPKQFFNHYNKHNQLAAHWFFDGLTEKDFLDQGLRVPTAEEKTALRKFLCDWGPEHNYKIAGVAFLIEQLLTKKKGE